MATWKTLKIISLLALLLVLVSVASAYNSSMINPKSNWTITDFINAYPDIGVKVAKTQMSSSGSIILSLFLLIFLTYVFLKFMGISNIGGFKI